MEYIETKWGGRDEQEEDIRAGSRNAKDWKAEAWGIVHDAVSLFVILSRICANIIEDG